MRSPNSHIRFQVCVASVTMLFGGIVRADMTSYNFTAITANSVLDPAIGESQLRLEVSDVLGQPNRALFTFVNSGPLASSITDVYFDDGTLLSIASISGSAGVSFSQGASPPDLPGGNAVGFQATAGFDADSDPPAQPNGVNPGESLAILFDLQAGQTYADVISALNLGIAQGPSVPGSLLVGIHVQGFADGKSESFVTGPPRNPPVPAPGAALLGSIGLGAIGYVRRRIL